LLRNITPEVQKFTKGNRETIQRFCQEMELAGGPRFKRVRRLLRRAEARLAACECGCARSAGGHTDEAARAGGLGAVPAAEAGNAGQVDGAVRTALRDAGLPSAEAVSTVMAQ